MAKAKLDSGGLPTPNDNVSFATPVSPGEVVSGHLSGGYGDALATLSRAGFALTESLAESNRKTVKLQMEEEKDRKIGEQTAGLYSAGANIFRDAIANRPEGMSSEDFGMQVRLKLFQEIGTGKYGMLTHSDFNGFMGAADVLLDKYYNTHRVFEDGSIITYNIQDGQSYINTNQHVLLEVMANKAKMKYADNFYGVVAGFNTAYAPDVAAKKIGDAMLDLRHIELRSASLNMQGQALTVAQKEQAYKEPIVKATLYQDVLMPNLESIRNIGKSLAPGFKGTQEELGILVSNMYVDTVMKSPNVLEAARSAGVDVNTIRDQAKSLGDAMGAEVAQRHKDAGVSAESARLEAQTKILENSIMLGLSPEQQAAVTLAPHFGMNAAMGLAIAEKKFGISTKNAAVFIPTVQAQTTQVDSLLADAARNKDNVENIKGHLNTIVRGLKAVKRGEQSELGASVFTYWHELKKSGINLSPEITEQIDTLYRSAAGDKIDVIEGILNGR